MTGTHQAGLYLPVPVRTLQTTLPPAGGLHTLQEHPAKAKLEFIKSFYKNPFNKYLLSTHAMSGAMPQTSDAIENKDRKLHYSDFFHNFPARNPKAKADAVG